MRQVDELVRVAHLGVVFNGVLMWLFEQLLAGVGVGKSEEEGLESFLRATQMKTIAKSIFLDKNRCAKVLTTVQLE